MSAPCLHGVSREADLVWPTDTVWRACVASPRHQLCETTAACPRLSGLRFKVARVHHACVMYI